MVLGISDKPLERSQNKINEPRQQRHRFGERPAVSQIHWCFKSIILYRRVCVLYFLKSAKRTQRYISFKENSNHACRARYYNYLLKNLITSKALNPQRTNFESTRDCQAATADYDMLCEEASAQLLTLCTHSLGLIKQRVCICAWCARGA